MASIKHSIIDKVEAEKASATTNEIASPEIAATVLQQEMMEQAGELQPVSFIGPNGKFIDGFYSPKERTFLPKFEI